MPTDALLNEEIIDGFRVAHGDIGAEAVAFIVLVHFAVNRLDNELDPEPVAALHQPFHFIPDVGVLAPIARIGRSAQNPAHLVSELRWPPFHVYSRLQNKIAKVTWRIFPYADFFRVAVTVAFRERFFGGIINRYDNVLYHTYRTEAPENVLDSEEAAANFTSRCGGDRIQVGALPKRKLIVMPTDENFENRARHFAQANDVPDEFKGVQELVKLTLDRSDALHAERMNLPPELHAVRDAARRAILPLKAADTNTQAETNLLFIAERTEAGETLPAYYLVYFLLVELLEFRDLGRSEKIAWSIPIDFNGVAYLIEHRKFGVGIFARKAPETEQDAQRIVALIKKGVRAAKPYFEWLARRAVSQSKINVSNFGRRLFDRYIYLRDSFRVTSAKAMESKALYEINEGQRNFNFPSYFGRETESATTSELITAFTPDWILETQRANWLAMAAIDAFFSWTEHVFILLAILQGKVTTGPEVADLVGADWGEKFKCSLEIPEQATKVHFDELVIIRRQLRNFMAHGAFGKEGEAFSFHSRAGAVPVVLDRRTSKTQLSLTPELAFDDTKALTTMETFIEHLWSGPRKAAQLYIQETDLPLILPMASNGTYKTAMQSVDEMQRFIDHLTRRFDDATNMDW